MYSIHNVLSFLLRRNNAAFLSLHDNINPSVQQHQSARHSNRALKIKNGSSSASIESIRLNQATLIVAEERLIHAIQPGCWASEMF